MTYNCSGKNNDFFEMAVRLADLFGDDVVVDGLAIAENGLVRIVRDDEGVFPLIYEVWLTDVKIAEPTFKAGV
uniref:Uncharacterized protein n=1 Tax=Meloidogyne javanica TaxID=6303 RepID=A0A915LZQ9_MELJA